ncbi:MAG: DUF4349 domain-containing protein [Clostridiales bacterium]|nr:DUF4349 domain-containing protein [Clostridiales bacterium]
MKRRLLTACLALLLLLSACSSRKSSPSESAGGDSTRNDMAAEYDGFSSSSRGEDQIDPQAAPPFEPAPEGNIYEGLERKLVYTGRMTLETLEFDAAYDAIGALTRRFGGYVESSRLDGRSVRGEDGSHKLVDRNASFELRIPSAEFDAFVKSVGDIGSVVSVGTDVQDISTTFYDTQSRLDAYQLQYDRLLALLEKADEMQDILDIEARLSEIRYQIEALTTQMRGYSSRVAYSKVTMELYEVSRYSPPADRFVTRLGDSLRDSLSGFGFFLQNLLFALIYLLPYAALLALALFLGLRCFGRLGLLQRLRRTRGGKLPRGGEALPDEREEERP